MMKRFKSISFWGDWLSRYTFRQEGERTISTEPGTQIACLQAGAKAISAMACCLWHLNMQTRSRKIIVLTIYR